MEEILSNITACVDSYEALPYKLTFNDCEVLSGILKTISSNLFYLEEYRDDYKREHTRILHEEMSNGTAVNRSEIIAEHKVPEIYMLRRFMISGYKVQDSLRTHISFLKKEQ